MASPEEQATRAARRAASWRIARDRWGQHRDRYHCDRPAIALPTRRDCVCLRSVWAFRKGTLGCHCAKRRHGRPKLGHGMCQRGAGRRGLAERREGRRLARAWLATVGAVPPEDVELTPRRRVGR